MYHRASWVPSSLEFAARAGRTTDTDFLSIVLPLLLSLLVRTTFVGVTNTLAFVGSGRRRAEICAPPITPLISAFVLRFQFDGHSAVTPAGS